MYRILYAIHHIRVYRLKEQQLNQYSIILHYSKYSYRYNIEEISKLLFYLLTNNGSYVVVRILLINSAFLII